MDGFYCDSTSLHSDVETFQMSHVDNPETVTGLLGGFPCQAGFLVRFIVISLVIHCGQGVSKAGRKRGMNDGRTALLKHFMRIYDSSFAM